MKQVQAPEEITVVGYVRESRCDEYDHVIGIEIVTDDEYFDVEMDGLGKELLEFLYSEVEVHGVIEEEKDGTKSLFVSSYEVLEENLEDDMAEDFGDNFDLDKMLYEERDDFN